MTDVTLERELPALRGGIHDLPDVGFAEAKLAVVWPELEPLLTKNHAEAGYFRKGDFRPRRERYLELEEAGVIRLFTARVKGQLVGYASFAVIEHLHTAGVAWAIQDALYVEPQHRGRVAVEFLHFQDLALGVYGVKYITRQVTTKVNYAKTLAVMGYRPTEVSYLRDMGV